jgi:3-methyladenine DNA glycosylase AlkD
MKPASAKAAPRKADVKSALAWLEAHGTVRYRDQLSTRFAIHTDKAYGTSMTDVKKLAKTIGTDHDLAQALWNTGWHEAKALAACIADPELTTPAMMEAWCRDFRNWADCDTVCFILFDKTPHAFAKVKQWAKRKPEYEKRAAFALLASLALHDRMTADQPFLALLPMIKAAADDDRNFVKKGVSWALRAMAWRSAVLLDACTELAEQMARSTVPSERWIGKDALRDITRPLVTKRVEKKDKKRATIKKNER